MLYGFGKILFMIYFRLFLQDKTTGIENIPSLGSVLLCANHPTAAGHVPIGVKVPKRKVHYMAKAELFRNRILVWALKHLGAFGQPERVT